MIPAEKFEALQRQLNQVTKNKKFLQIVPQRTAAERASAAGVAQWEAGNTLGAEESFRMALAFDPGNFDAAMGIAGMLMAEGKVAAAEAFLNQRKPAFWKEDPAVTLRFAKALDGAGDWLNAEKAYSIVIALEPKNGIALNNLAFLLSQHGGDLDDALMYAERAGKQMPDSPEASDTLGYVHIQRGELDAAFEAFQTLLQKAPEHAEHLAILLAVKGRADMVREKIIAALANNSSPSANQALQAILNKLR
jgi:Tfp pilus assembly protein PilF